MTRLRQMKGFTLIELIVVVIIIGVLAAIAAVAYNAFVGDSRDKAAKATAIQVDKAITAKSAADDKTPAAEVVLYKAAFTSTFGLQLNNATVTADSGTAPTKLEVTSGTRSYCITLGGAAGQNGSIPTTAGGCGAAGALITGGTLMAG